MSRIEERWGTHTRTGPFVVGRRNERWRHRRRDVAGRTRVGDRRHEGRPRQRPRRGTRGHGGTAPTRPTLRAPCRPGAALWRRGAPSLTMDADRNRRRSAADLAGARRRTSCANSPTGPGDSSLKIRQVSPSSRSRPQSAAEHLAAAPAASRASSLAPSPRSLRVGRSNSITHSPRRDGHTTQVDLLRNRTAASRRADW